MSALPQPLVLVVSQIRLMVGPYVLVAARADADIQTRLWAIPGGAIATYHQVTRLARYHEWGRPRPISVIVRYRAPDAPLIQRVQV